MIRVLLVDDHALMRAGLSRILDERPDIEIVAEADSGEDAIQLAREHTPDVVLMDIQMPGIGGMEATRRMLSYNDKLRIVALSMYGDDPFPGRMLSVGAAGYLTKDCAADEIVNAIRKVHSGGNYVTPSIAGKLAVALATGKTDTPFSSLSQREMQVMLMVTNGSSIQEISDTLNLSPKTVSTYRYRLFEKLDVTNDVELTRMAMRHGLLDGGEPISD